jgi:hypothetical protein
MTHKSPLASIVVAAALSSAALLSLPSDASARDSNSNAGCGQAAQRVYGSPLDAFAFAPNGAHSAPVVVDGRTVARDPDVNIRQQLERDYYFLRN